MRRTIPLAVPPLSLPVSPHAAPKAPPAPKATSPAKSSKGGAVAAATPLPAGEKPITEQDLLKALDSLKMGDPIQARPRSAEEPALPLKPATPAVLTPLATPAPLTTAPSTTDPVTT